MREILTTKEAIEAMFAGEVLYDSDGNQVWWAEWEDRFIVSRRGKRDDHITICTDLSRSIPEEEDL